MINLKYKKYITSIILILLISSLGIFVFETREALAFSLLDIGFTVVAKTIATIGAIVHSIVSLFFWLAAMFLELAIGIEGYTDAGIVTMGWAITRDLANMFFVLVLLVIAFATILRIETHGMKQILWKLIVAALLINFSLVIAGTIIDFSQILTNFFYEEVKSANGISGQIAKILNTPELSKMDPDATIGDKIAAGSSGLVMMTFSIFFGIILILAAAFAIFLGAFFLLVRMIILWILLILAPLAWFFWIIPGTAHLFQQWWSTFLKWVFFAPVYMFFIYLAIKTGEAGSFSGIIQQQMQTIVEASGWKETLFTTLSPAMFIQFLTVIGLLFGGLIVAQKMGVYGAEGAMKLAKGVANMPIQRGKMTAANLVSKSKIGDRMNKAGEFMGKSKILSATGLPFVTKQMARTPREFEEKERAGFAESEKKYKNWTTDNLKTEREAANPRDKAAIDTTLAKRKGGFDGFDDNKIESMINLSKRYGKEGDIIKARPDKAHLAGKTTEEVISNLKPKDIEHIQAEAYNNDKVQGAFLKEFKDPNGKLGKSILIKAADENPALNITLIKKIIEPNINEMKSEIQTYYKTTTGKAVTGEKKIVSSVTDSEFKEAKEKSDIIT